MSVQELKPEGLDDLGLHYAQMTLRPRVFAQGASRGNIVVWLAIGGLETMIGEGEPEAAIAEAMKLLESLRDNVRPQVAALLEAPRRTS